MLFLELPLSTSCCWCCFASPDAGPWRSSQPNAVLVIVTLLFIDIMMSQAKGRSTLFEKLVDGVPTIIVEHGRPLRDRMRKARVDEQDVMEAARRLQGLERMDQIKYAILEVSGGITVIP